MGDKWYVVGEPWGDGTWIVEGNPDPHLGLQVADCNMIDGEVAFDGKVGPSPEQRAEQIVREHNAFGPMRTALLRAAGTLDALDAPGIYDIRVAIDEALALAHPQGDQDG